MNLNSLYVWYPKTKNIMPTPKTIFIKQKRSFNSFDALFDNRADPEMNRMVAEAKQAAQKLGYPVFLRSSHLSNKHEWKNSCYATSDQSLEDGMYNILEFTLMGFGIAFDGYVVREFLTLPHELTAFKGMPVSKEFRFFIKNGEVICYHPYWFPACMTYGLSDEKNWLAKLRKIQAITPAEKNYLTEMALKISKAVEPIGAPDNYWSVDFCWTEEYGWTLTDMALGPESYHYNTCKNTPEEQKNRFKDPEEIPERYDPEKQKARANRYERIGKDWDEIL